MSTLAVNSITDASSGNTATINGMTPTADSLQGFRNRIINGDMRIDQRNAGASVSLTGDAYSLDRWRSYAAAASDLSVQQSSTAPSGFVNSALYTSLAATTPGATDRYAHVQFIEGTNCADLAWGTADAKTVTLSFRVRSSLTGTFGGALSNSATDRSYPFTYSISSANTWEYKTVTIPGDTTGTWLTTTGTGIRVWFSLGAGADRKGTAGSWAAANYISATGAVDVVGTNGATFYITGVQLEVGSVATEFERRPYGTELALCQRYFEKTVTTDSLPFIAQAYSTTKAQAPITWKVTKRAPPTIAFSGTATSYTANGTANSATYTFFGISPDSAFSEATTTGLVAGNASLFYTTGTSAFTFSAEL